MFSHRSVRLVVLAALLVLLALAGSLVIAQSDARLNQRAYFGGDALYCIDANGYPTTDFFPNGTGEFRLLNARGEILWRVDGQRVLDRVAQSQALGGEQVVVARGQGSYGPTTLKVYSNTSALVRFIFSGYDQYGKLNQFSFPFCTPVRTSSEFNPPALPTLTPTPSPIVIPTATALEPVNGWYPATCVNYVGNQPVSYFCWCDVQPSGGFCPAVILR